MKSLENLFWIIVYSFFFCCILGISFENFKYSTVMSIFYVILRKIEEKLPTKP